jgi:hypothetical protein
MFRIFVRPLIFYKKFSASSTIHIPRVRKEAVYNNYAKSSISFKDTNKPTLSTPHCAYLAGSCFTRSFN